jgi:crossover junction endodeoxyribonuclease RusA
MEAQMIITKKQFAGLLSKRKRRTAAPVHPVRFENGTITLPYPPSANEYWRSVGRGQVLLSAKARAYKEKIEADLAWLGAPRIIGGAILYLDLFRPQCSGDLDNYLKVTIDALKGIAFEDDKHIAEIHARRFEDKERPRVEVRIVSLEAGEKEEAA